MVGTELAELAAAGASAMAGAVATDVWHQVRDRVGRLLTRGREGRVEAARLEVDIAELLDADEHGWPERRERVERDWEQRLLLVLADHPDAVAELRSLLDTIGLAADPRVQVTTVHNEISGGRHGITLQIGTNQVVNNHTHQQG
ncbi:hypothetical protein [Streptomyces sp. TLI_171]|uniref:hypothetical protein n=1 Tax=Streptomyces sp. TLI_171 TaxID=1938859 RepID=UPI000C179095|nr:hypothetical protein [Streptomyces sp. TLI_171]RKE17027.1 hypothetical protein BX266_0278 [Streptomyces sp. TLI_171]